MGGGYNLTIVNGTPNNWTQNDSYTYQMSSDSGSFPQTIGPFFVYIEFSDAHWAPGDDRMWAQYAIDGTSSSFRIDAKNGSSDPDKLHFELTGMSTLSDGQGNDVSIGSVWNQVPYPAYGGSAFVLAGVDGAWVSSSSTSAIGPWMSQSLKYIGDRDLRHICIPGSHDSGMSELTHSMVPSSAQNVVTQHLAIRDQLRMGIRYFDIRPVKWNGELRTGHVGDTAIGHQGGTGQSIDDVVNDVNGFTSSYPELVILNISHDCNTDNNWNGFSDSDWNDLLPKLDNINYRYNADANANLSTTTLNTFIGDGRARVILRFESSGGDITSRLGKGFFKSSSMVISDNYANSDDPDTLEKDQFGKLASSRASADSDMFSLDWALTMQNADVVTDNLLDWADHYMSPRLGADIMSKTTKDMYPNIIGVDGVRTTDVVAVATAINARAVHG